ncbi:hypothetical protein Peur_045820 [Populus x canadensis]|jgi:hypothetical protein
MNQVSNKLSYEKLKRSWLVSETGTYHECSPAAHKRNVHGARFREIRLLLARTVCACKFPRNEKLYGSCLVIYPLSI